MAKKFITSALLYANGPLHIGHLVEYIQTDIYVRFLRLTGDDVIYCCADDTHGAPVQINAEKLGITPEKLIEKFYKEHTRDFEKFGIKFDNYYTTHSEENHKLADLLFEKAKKNGYIFKEKITQLFCPHDNMFLPDRYVRGTCPKCGAEEQYGDVCEKCGATYKPTELKSPKCSMCNTLPIKKDSEHYFFKLSAFSEQLEEWLGSTNLQKEIVNSVKQWIKEGLNDWDISRDGPYFGFKIPNEENLYYYVWWDAPIGYLASLQNLTKDAQKEWHERDVLHVIGKDIIYFHFLFWPAVLMATGFTLPKSIFVHGFLTVNGEKMSKSRGTFITAEDFAKQNEPENLRYFFARMTSKKLSDIDLNFDDLDVRVNNELVANIANFCYRSLSFTNKNFDSEISTCQNTEVINEITKLFESVKEHYKNFNFKEAVSTILKISDIGNKYFQDNAPWKLIKEDREKAKQVLTVCINIAKNLSILLQPIMPGFSSKLQTQLGVKNLVWDDLGFEMENTKIKKAELLIKKLEKKEKQEFPLNLKVGEIKEARAHPDADKLLILQVNLGSEKRQIVAGLKEYYKPEILVGKKIIVVCNLKKARLRGEESNGMLLAASSGDKVQIINPKAEIGSQVTLEGLDVDIAELKIDKFIKVNKLSVDNKKLCYDKKELSVNGVSIDVDMPDGSKVR